MSNAISEKNKKKRKIQFPHAFVLLFGIIIFVGILTYIVPAGEFNRIEVNGRSVVDPTSFHLIEQTPVSVFDFFTAIPKGLQEASFLMIMILIIGGAIRVFDGTGAIRAAILKLTHSIGEERSGWVLSAIMLFFGCLGAFPGMLEAAIPFAPLCIGIALTLGYDALVGIAISLLPIAIGWSAGPSNPWTVGIGQSVAELPMFSGFGYRMFVFVVFMAVSFAFVLRYANKIKKDPTKSVIYGMDIKHLQQSNKNQSVEFTKSHQLVLTTFVITIAFIVYGALKWKWGIPQMCATYIIGAIIGGKFAGYNSGKIADELLEGGKEIFIGAMAAGLARSISVIMADGHIADTIVYGISSVLNGLPPMVTAIGMFIAQTIINFFIPSGSGQALITLPILIPVADIIDLNRQIAILAYQFGDGLSNLCYPTVGGLVAFLIYSRISFNKWLKFIMPFMLAIWAAAVVCLAGAVMINFGPF
ncbi:TIGR00366 family protein [Clostridiaceae bacterium 35-E11]